MFYTYKMYLKERYGKPAFRVSVDGGFSCPNRNRDGSGGCTYCDELGAVAVYQRTMEADLAHSGDKVEWDELVMPGRTSPYAMEQRKAKIKKQVEAGIRFLERRYKAELFILYFQAFTNTFAPVPVLKELYDYGLSLADFRELVVSTRPDCVSPAVADLLASYRDRDFDVWAELGLQSAHDITLGRVNRGHTVNDFERAFGLLKERGLKVTVHLIFGLPGENRKEIMETVDYLSGIKPDGIKIHNLHIPVRTALFDEYMYGELTVPSGLRHLSYVNEALERLPDDIVIHRLTCDTPDHRLGAPRTFFKKGSFLNLLRNRMEKEGSFQGRRFHVSH